jgi:hypothetical protein
MTNGQKVTTENRNATMEIREQNTKNYNTKETENM